MIEWLEDKLLWILGLLILILFIGMCWAFVHDTNEDNRLLAQDRGLV